MYARLSILTPPESYPVTPALVKSHTRIDNADDDDLLSIYIASATAMVEMFLNRSLLPQTLMLSIAESFPASGYLYPFMPSPVFVLPLAVEYALQRQPRPDIELPRSPVQSVLSVSYAKFGDPADTVLDAADYDVDLACDPARLRLHADLPWPNRSHLSITYTTGYPVGAIPVPVIHALLLVTANIYEHRGDQEAGDLIPQAAQSLLWPFRLLTFA